MFRCDYSLHFIQCVTLYFAYMPNIVANRLPFCYSLSVFTEERDIPHSKLPKQRDNRILYGQSHLTERMQQSGAISASIVWLYLFSVGLSSGLSGFSDEGLGRSLHRDIFTGLQHLTRQNPDYGAFEDMKRDFVEAARGKVGAHSIEDLPYFKVINKICSAVSVTLQRFSKYLLESINHI